MRHGVAEGFQFFVGGFQQFAATLELVGDPPASGHIMTNQIVHGSQQTNRRRAPMISRIMLDRVVVVDSITRCARAFVSSCSIWVCRCRAESSSVLATPAKAMARTDSKSFWLPLGRMAYVPSAIAAAINCSSWFTRARWGS